MHVHLDEWSIEPDVTDLRSGVVSLEFGGHNHGGIPHELVILKTDLDADSLPVTQGKVDLAAAGYVAGEISIDELPPDATAARNFSLDSGHYVLICNVAGHYSQGMYAALTVE